MRLSIIIPTLNEVRYLADTINQSRRQARMGPPEIIVSDCDSGDGTADLARRLGVRVVAATPPASCRATALNRGAAVAGGDTLLFLDADTRPPTGYDRAIARALRAPRVVGGAFEFALDGTAFSLRLVEIINRIRYRVWPRYYGDQGLFARADAFHRTGGYPERRLMEASMFSLILARQGELALLRLRMTTSARRFLEGGVYPVLAHDARLWWLDLWRRPTDAFAEGYWEENRRRGKNLV